MSPPSRFEDLRRDKLGQPDLSGLSFAFFGGFSFWPSYHQGPPEIVARRLGAEIRPAVDPTLDVLVIGSKRAKGRADARRKAESLRRRQQKRALKGEDVVPIEILDEDAFRHLVKLDVTGKSFTFFGDFEYCPPGFDDGRPPALTEAAGGIVRERVDEDLDYLVLGNRRGRGKTAAKRQAEAIRAAGGALQILSEEGFLELVRSEQPTGGELDFPSFLAQLRGIFDPRKLTRALKMLKAESFQLYVDVDDRQLVGVVRSQTGAGSIYSPWLTAKGRYGCSTPELYSCMGLQGKPCKHLMVLLVGLARTGGLDPTLAYEWAKATRGKRPKDDEDLAADTFLRYKGAEAGEIDWRPLETVPEDYYAF